MALFLAVAPASHGQAVAPTTTPEPIATPTAAPEPTETPAPTASPTPIAAPGTGVFTAGITDLSAYREARRPTISVAVTYPASVPVQNGATVVASSVAAAGVSGGVTATLRPHISSRVFSSINLGYLNGSNPPPAATVTLQFNPTRAGALIWVQALDGGDLQTPSTGSSPTDLGTGGWIALDATGQMSFTFQAPALTARYQVMLRLDNVSAVLPFIVPTPQ